MNTYTIHFRNDAAWARHELKATTPEAALILARTLLENDSLDLVFETYDVMSDVNEIAVSNAAGEELLAWHDEDMRLRLAGRELLAALKQAVTALNTAPRFRVPGLETDSYAIASVCDRAIARAEAGAP